MTPSFPFSLAYSYIPDKAIGPLPHVSREHDPEVRAACAERHLVAVQHLARGALQGDVREQAFGVEASQGVEHLRGVAHVVEVIHVEVLGSPG